VCTNSDIYLYKYIRYIYFLRFLVNGRYDRFVNNTDLITSAFWILILTDLIILTLENIFQIYITAIRAKFSSLRDKVLFFDG
jgi:hypothetical protein